MAEEEYRPLFPRPKRRELPSGLIVEYEKLPEEVRKQRRADNKAMKQSRQLHRKRKKHGRQ